MNFDNYVFIGSLFVYDFVDGYKKQIKERKSSNIFRNISIMKSRKRQTYLIISTELVLWNCYDSTVCCGVVIIVLTVFSMISSVVGELKVFLLSSDTLFLEFFLLRGFRFNRISQLPFGMKVVHSFDLRSRYSKVFRKVLPERKLLSLKLKVM